MQRSDGSSERNLTPGQEVYIPVLARPCGSEPLDTLRRERLHLSVTVGAIMKREHGELVPENRTGG